MDRAPDRRGEHVLAPLALNIRPLAQHLLLEIAHGFRVAPRIKFADPFYVLLGDGFGVVDPENSRAKTVRLVKVLGSCSMTFVAQ